jgi:XTP/dITP diphosphohydrolase
MKIILATSNKGKIKEIRECFKNMEVLPYSEVLGEFEIEENGKTFKENAMIKAKAVFDKLDKKEGVVVLSDDSGISLPILGNAPGIYSARYAGEGASAKDNLYKLIDDLKKRGIKKTPAFYTAAIALATDRGIFSVHGWMYGSAISEARGDNGFGYDPMFIPEGFDKTLGELDEDVKKRLSHRSKALQRAKILLYNL